MATSVVYIQKDEGRNAEEQEQKKISQKVRPEMCHKYEMFLLKCILHTVQTAVLLHIFDQCAKLSNKEDRKIWLCN